MKKIVFLAFALLLAPHQARAIETGTANQVLRYPNSAPAGTRPTYGTVNLASTAAVTGNLLNSRGGTGLDTSASTGVPTISSGTWSVSSTLAPVRGGLGFDASAIATGGMIYGTGAGTFGIAPAGTDGYVREQQAGIPSWQPTEKANFILNSGFDYWQRTTSTTIANAGTAYLADRWFVKNATGTNGVITYSRQTSGSSGDVLYGAKVQITTAPTAAQVNGLELAQTFDNATSLRAYNKTASIGVQVKAFGNVNSVIIRLLYNTTETKATNGTGTTISSNTCSVSTGSFTLCKLENVSVGTGMTTSGSIGISLMINGVSSGNTYDLNNGFQAERASFTLSAIVPPVWTRALQNAGAEIAALERFYEKSYALTTAPGAVTSVGFTLHRGGVTGTDYGYVKFSARKRTVPAMTYYSDVTGTSGKIRDNSGAADINPADNGVGEGGANFTFSATATNSYSWHWTADAEI